MTAELERALSQQVQRILVTQATAPLQQVLAQVAGDLNLLPIELAAALVYLDDAMLVACRSIPSIEANEVDLKKQLVEQLATALQISDLQPEKTKMVRYRIEIGQNHQVTSEDIKSVLISESGVERAKIGHLEIRNTYSLIDLPPGMPPDIFQLLQSVEIKKQALQIKRVNVARKKSWPRRKGGFSKRSSERESNQGNG